MLRMPPPPNLGEELFEFKQLVVADLCVRPFLIDGHYGRYGRNGRNGHNENDDVPIGMLLMRHLCNTNLFDKDFD
jgi:hypothetical protein